MIKVKIEKVPIRNGESNSPLIWRITILKEREILLKWFVPLDKPAGPFLEGLAQITGFKIPLPLKEGEYFLKRR